MLPFKVRLTLEQRKDEFARVRHRRDNFVPVIMEASGTDTPRMDKEKFLVAKDLTMGQLSYVVRRRVCIEPSHALFLLVGERLVSTTTLVGSMYDAHHDEDGFVYVTYTTENAFGGGGEEWCVDGVGKKIGQ